MGQAAKRQQYLQAALQQLKQYGLDQALPDPDAQASAQWLHRHFVPGLRQAAGEGVAAWHNQVYLEAQRHRDPAIRRGIRALMNDVLTGGLEAGRVVFALLADATLARPEVAGEFDHCEPLAQWVAAQLQVPRHNVRVRHSVMFVPARAGLFGLVPTLELITATKPVGKHPDVASRKGTRAAQQYPRLTFLVSVFTGGSLELDHLAPAAGSAPVFALPYWGPEDATPDQVANVTPVRALQVFDALEMLGFWEQFQDLDAALAPLRPQAESAAASAAPASTPAMPVLEVSLRAGGGPQLAQGMEVLARWRDVDMAPVPAYQGGFAEYFIAQLERLAVHVERAPGILPPAPDGPLFTPEGRLHPEHEASAAR